MKYYAALFFIICVIVLPLPGHAADPGNIYLRSLEGDVQVRTDDTKEWLPASINMSLIDGDQIWVPDNGRAELLLRNGTVTRLDKNTYLEILASEDQSTRFYLGAGHLYGNTIVEKGNAVVFETPTGSFHAYLRSVFRIDVSENEDSAASVFQGELYADRGTGQMKISAGDRITMRKDAQYPILAKLAPADQWEQWNRQKDREFSVPQSSYGTTHLPDELRSYSSDLDRNGQWVYEKEYGYVWTPTVVVVQNWSPYRVGRWVWMRGDYVWISYEPWGWAPYHYGRWAFLNTRGWCWVPPGRGFAYWGPGYVGWVHTPTYISWVPLAPGEIYYGHGNYGPHSVNIKNVTIQNITVNRTVYKNIHVDNAVTTMHRDTFMTGRQVKLTAKENLFLKEKRIMGSPEGRPEKTAYTPVIKDIPEAKRPPSRFGDRVLKTSEPPGAINRIRQMNGKKVDVPQQTYDATQGIRQERPAMGKQAVQKISQVLPEERTKRLNELKNKNQVKNAGKEIPPVTGQFASARITRAQERKSDIENKTPAVSAARQRVSMRIERQQSPSVKPQAQQTVKSPAVISHTQSLKKEDIQTHAATQEAPSREAAPRTERKGGR